MSNNYSKIGTIIRHEYLTKVKSKGFIIATLVGPLGIALFFGVIFLATYLSMTESPDKKIAFKDYSGKYAKEIVAAKPNKYFITNDNEKALKDKILREELDGFVIIPENVLESGKVILYTGGSGGLSLNSQIESDANRIISHDRLIKAGATEEIIKLADQSIGIENKRVTEEGVKKSYVEMYAALGYILGIVIYVMMLSYGGLVQRGVIEEKANRIIEIIASSARPYDIMMGKVIGIGAVGLTQMTIWIILSSLVMMAFGPIMHLMNPDVVNTPIGGVSQSGLPGGFEIPPLSPWLGVGFIFYFLSGYFLYATIYAAIGSAVDQESDAQQLSMPITMLVILPMLFISVVISNPDGTVSTILSLIPFFTPTLMIIRVAASEVPLWQIILSTVLMIGSFMGCIYVASKIYRVGILMYGKKPKFSELIKWVSIKS
jgi:ABC-2 type transport system permease protein